MGLLGRYAVTFIIPVLALVWYLRISEIVPIVGTAFGRLNKSRPMPNANIELCSHSAFETLRSLLKANQIDAIPRIHQSPDVGNFDTLKSSGYLFKQDNVYARVSANLHLRQITQTSAQNYRRAETTRLGFSQRCWLN
jgi:hypothetical protein